MKFIFFICMFFSLQAAASDSTKLYNPSANAEHDVAMLLQKAKSEGKHVLLQVGGNWCVWCYRFNAFVQTDSALKKLLDNNYLVYHLNYSKENKNLAYLAKLGYPQRFGFPVLVVLDADGTRLHTQDSGMLEKGNGYDDKKVTAFLNNWTAASLNAALYKE